MIARVASIPSMTGISRSISTTSGVADRHIATASAPLAAVATSSMSGCARDHAGQPVAQHAVVVGDGDADHRDGTSSSTRVPAPSLELIARLPPESRASSSTSDRPRWPSASRCSRIAGSKPRPSSDDHQPGDAVVDRQLDSHRVGVRVRDHVAHGLLRDAVDERLLLAVEPLRSVDRDRHLHAARLERADEVGDRGLEPRGGEMRRMELDEQRAQVADRSAKTVDLPCAATAASSFAPRAAAPSASGASEKARPAMSCTGPSWRYEATRWRSRADAATAFAEQRLTLLVSPLEPARQRPDERSLDQHDQRRSLRGSAGRALRADAARSR